jgi:N-methylhydantoinase B
VRNFVEGRWNLHQPRRVKCPPWGLWSGKAGGTAAYLLRTPGASDYEYVDASRYPVPADSVVVVRTGGGGGWGDPLERDPARVQGDVVEDLVSAEAAREQYGVVLREDFSLDEPATRALRTRLRPSSSAPAVQ